ncbi:ribonuclease J [Sphingobium indicum]|uniref:RNA-metabolising metallo-beta-lactamase n=3 Tax=Sphingobium indicum TaxID=332055 RepID=A0A8E0WQQ5_9SPHN|nr:MULTISPECIES: ribonuclease J [Sphingobium]EPR16453.1 RNA-metabolising metallo-beta-lactamase [Sphingobium indicum IP26]KEY98177.1 RNA-metabolising metallo-beta-lactamase [Sphingomonas sp. BHC-A]APL94379.1 MBL fold metallo-hydrolase [Sphingobium indicum B90A]EQA98900.1 RNA-metabolising metallo-beta-lactamase [Sphingobium sp. HDIP04]KER35665.1 RNA-metabolising metallo-beta-lactamase [Sphingobium indicum F2]
MIPGNELIFLALGGSGEIGMNVNLYGCQGKWVMVDLGLTFADPAYPGVELVLPDLSFIEDRKDDLLGIVLTHGHEDHIGAIPYLAADLGVPLYATPFTAGLIRLKLEEEGLTEEVELNVIDNEGSFALGPFGFRYVPLAHSIPEGNAVLIDTPHGKIFHTGDWKLDETPLLGQPSTPEELTAIGDEGVLALVCDSTNVFNPEASGSEGDVREGLMSTIKGAKGRVLVTTFASNAARLQTLGEVANAVGRKLCVAGRSLDRIISTARTAGYLRDFPPTVDWDDAMALPRNEVMIIATGGQGEARAALSRIAFDSHPIKLDEGDLVVFSSKQIPGNEIAIGRIQNALAAKGVLMVTDRQAEVHVSGHPGRPELEAMYRWVRPQILLPVHGERRHMAEQARLGLASGVPHAVVQSNGDVLRLAPDGPEIIGNQATGRLVLDGDVILPADGATMNERRKVALHGQISVAVALDGKGRVIGSPALRTQGVPVEEDKAAFLEEAADEAAGAVAKGSQEEEALRERVRLAVRRTATRWTGKKPVVDVLLIRA